MAVPSTGDAGLYPVAMVRHPPAAWTVGVLICRRSSIRFQTKKLRLFLSGHDLKISGFEGGRKEGFPDRRLEWVLKIKRPVVI
jgi:hypothetical protein